MRAAHRPIVALLAVAIGGPTVAVLNTPFDTIEMLVVLAMAITSALVAFLLYIELLAASDRRIARPSQSTVIQMLNETLLVVETSADAGRCRHDLKPRLHDLIRRMEAYQHAHSDRRL